MHHGAVPEPAAEVTLNDRLSPAARLKVEVVEAVVVEAGTDTLRAESAPFTRKTMEVAAFRVFELHFTYTFLRVAARGSVAFVSVVEALPQTPDP